MDSRARASWMAAAAALAMLAAPAPAGASVGIKEGVVVGRFTLVRTTQNEIHLVERPGLPTRRLGHLPRNASPLAHDDRDAWSVTTGRRRARRVRLYRIDPRARDIQELAVAREKGLGRIEVEGIAGVDPRFIFLSPDGRVDRETGELRRGHLESFPDLTVLRTVSRGPATWYLAAGPAAGPRDETPLWILRSRSGRHPWLRASAGIRSSPVFLVVDDGDLFVIHRSGPIFRFDERTLRFREDLTPMRRPEEIAFFSADRRSYWIMTAPGTEGTGGDLWRIDRETLDGGLYHAQAVPPGFVTVADDGGRLWFGARERHVPRPLMAVEKAGATAQAYSVNGMHERRLRAFGRGVGNALLGTVEVAGMVVLGAVAIVTAPIWVPIASSM